MDLARSLYIGEQVTLDGLDYESDAPIEARWTADASYLRSFQSGPALPLTEKQVKKNYEALEKEMDEQRSLFYFAIRLNGEKRFIGFSRLYWISWSQGTARLDLGIGEPHDRRKGYGSEALSLTLRYAFDEVNFFRVEALIPGYNQAALGLFSKAGFEEEVCRREALARAGRRWDLYHYGLLAEDWRTLNRRLR